MNIYLGNDAQPSERKAIVAIGTFDGVHRGHQLVLRRVVDWAKDAGGAPAGVLTFREHPHKTLKDHAPDMLTSLEHRLTLFEREHITFVWALDFTPELSKLNASQFAKKFLISKLAAQGLALGFDSQFGCDRIGKDSPELKRLARSLSLSVRSVEPAMTPDGEIISSTRIRDAIFEGRLRDAEILLGRHVSVYGTVAPGDARGRRLGYHTANLNLDREVRPPFGVYATVAIVAGKRYRSVTNVGYRPTITQHLPPDIKPDLLIETHLFDFAGDLYDKKMEVFFIEKLRDERRFSDVTALVEQIKKDEAKARAILEAQSKW
ncbi:MAG: riboflavin biosynthesis protein RibF [Planctomycetota bacterium]